MTTPHPTLDDIMRERRTAFVFQPQITEQPDHTWRAHYPAADWSVTAPTQDAARAKLEAEMRNRIRDEDAVDWQTAAVHTYLENGPIPGVYEIDLDTNERIMTATNPQAALNDVIANIERSRRQA